MAGGEQAAIDRRKPLRVRLVAAIITGTYAWALTVLPPILVLGSASLAGVAAIIALLALWCSPFLPRGRLALIAGLEVFVGFCLLSWWGGRHQPIDPPFSIFGSFGWLAYTFALGSLSTPSESDAEGDPGPHLEPRTPPSRLSAIALLFAIGASLILLGAAWLVERPAVSVLGHVFALASVLILLRSGAHVATYLQVRGTKLSRPPQLKRALWPLFGLFLLMAVAFVWLWRPA